MEKNKTEVNFYDLMKAIKNGVLRHDRQLFIGELLIRNSITEYQLDDKELINMKLNTHLDRIAYNVLSEIQDKFPKIKIVEKED